MVPLGFRQTQMVRAPLKFQQGKQVGRETERSREREGERARGGARGVRERRGGERWGDGESEMRGAETQAGRADPCASAQRKEEGKAG